MVDSSLFFFFSSENKSSSKKESSRTCTRMELKERMWDDLSRHSMRKAGTDFLAPNRTEGPCSLAYKADLHPLSDEKEWAGDWGIDWLGYANVFLISWSFPVKQQCVRNNCIFYLLACKVPGCFPALFSKGFGDNSASCDWQKKKRLAIYSPYIPPWRLIV